MNTPAELLSSPIDLPAAPEAASRILHSAQLAAEIASDPALPPRVLRLANSALYCGPNTVDDIDSAIATLGPTLVRNLTLSCILADTFKTTAPSDPFDSDRFWRRSIVSAVACELISRTINFKSDDTFITALIQDLGLATMFTTRTDEYLRVLDEKLLTALPVATVEKRVFGFDHQEVGSELLKAWGLPASIYMPIFYHHDTYNVPHELVAISSVLRASDRISAIYYGTSSARNVRDAKEILSRSFGLNDERAGNLIDAVAHSSIEILHHFGLESRGIKSFSEVLHEADEEFDHLNMSRGMLLLEYKQSKDRAERLTADLKKANGRLHDVAFRDGLTGLYNYRFFHEALGGELARAERYKRFLGLVVLDIDHFSEINETYGHQHGDIVLRTIGEEITLRMRKSDLVARYGGDKFALLLPETALSSAIATGEVCRGAIQKAIKAAGILSPITISIGAASFDPSKPITTTELIAAADEALTRSRQGGVYA